MAAKTQKLSLKLGFHCIDYEYMPTGRDQTNVSKNQLDICWFSHTFGPFPAFVDCIVIGNIVYLT